jgi:hypothetical protein
MEPEWPTIQALDAAYYALIASFKGTKDTSEAYGHVVETYTVVKTELRDRLLEKLRQLIETYKYQEDKFLDVGLAWLITKMSSIGLESNNGTMQWAEAEMKKWAKEVWNELMRDVVEKHDYRIAYHLSTFVTAATMFVLDFGQQNWQQLLANALTFDVKHNIDFNGDGVLFYKLSGTTTVKMNQYRDVGKNEVDFYGSKAGTGIYDSATAAESQFVGPSTYDQTVVLSNLDPCKNKSIAAGFSVFGAETENWKITAEGMNYPFTMPGPVRIAFYAYAQSHIDNAVDSPTFGGLKFDLPLLNMSAKAADETFYWSHDAVISLDVIVTHTPQGEVYIK